jgi:transposase
VVGLETAHNLLVDYLWEQGYTSVYVLPPNAVKSAQGRYRQSGAKDDHWDARLIADMLRTDQKRYRLWQPDSRLTCQIRLTVRFVNHLNRELVRNTNRLRAVLLRYYPAALQLFSRLDAPVTLAFIQCYPTPQAAARLSFTEFQAFLRRHHHTQSKKWAKIYSQLQAVFPSADERMVAAYAPQASTLANLLAVLVASKSAWQKELTGLYQQHPERELFASLPGAGVFLEPALLAKLGDDRQRFPSPQVLQAVAGTCPVTRRSGKRKHTYFRRACDREFRHIVQQWAKQTLDVSPWAQAYYRSVLPHCRTQNDAIRRLANRWLDILWTLWQRRTPYDQEYHLQQHTLRCKPRPTS